MQAFRDMMSGWVGKTLLVLLLGPFAIVGIESYFVGGKATAVATVNGNEISQHEFDRQFDQQKQRILASLGPSGDVSRIDSAVLREQILKGLIDRQVLAQKAYKSGFVVDDASFWRLIQDTPAFQENGKFSEQQYIKVLRGAGEDPATFPTKAKQELAVAQLSGGIAQTVFISNKEMDALSALDNQKRDVHVMTLAAANYVPKVTVTPAEIDAEYKAHPQRYTSEEQVALDYIQLGAEQFLTKATFTDADIEARYAEKVKALESNEQRHAAHILINVNDKVKDADALAKIKELEQRVKAGEDFGALAKQYSQDPGSATNNGDLGTVGRGAFVPEFEKALYALKQGEVSTPVKTQYGYHLIKLLDIQKAPVPTLAELKPQIEGEVRQSKAEDLYGEAIDKLDALVYESSDLKEAAQQYGLTVMSTSSFPRKGGEGVAANRKVIQAAFSDDLLKDNKNSQAIRLEDNHTVWLHLKSHQAAQLLPLAQVTAQIEGVLKLDKASALAKADAEAINKELTAGKVATDVATAHQQTWQDYLATQRRAPTPAADALKVAFRLPVPAANTWSSAVTPVGKDYAVVAVSHVDNGASSLSAEEKQQFGRMLANLRGQQQLQDYVTYLRSTAKIKQEDAKKDDK